MGTIRYLRVFDRDFVDALLAMTWPEYLRRYSYFGSQWETPEKALTDFFLEPEPEDEQLARSIVRSWTLRRTMRHCIPKVFFLETLLESIHNIPKRRIDGYTVEDDSDDADGESMTLDDKVVGFGNAMIDAFFEQRVSKAAFRAAMKLVSPVVRYTSRSVQRILKNDHPKIVFSGVPPFGETDRETALSSTETRSLFRVIEKGWREGWLRDCSLGARLRDVSRDRQLRKPVLVWYAQ